MQRTQLPFGGGQYPNFPSFPAEAGSMVHRQAGFGLPLMHHLVQQGVLYLFPRMPGEVPAAYAYFLGSVGVVLQYQLSQPSAHPAGQADGNRTQATAEMTEVELMVQLFQPAENRRVTRSRALRASRPGPPSRRESNRAGSSKTYAPSDISIRPPGPRGAERPEGQAVRLVVAEREGGRAEESEGEHHDHHQVRPHVAHGFLRRRHSPFKSFRDRQKKRAPGRPQM